MATESFFSSASLAYLASAGAGKDGKTYSIKPTDGSGDFTFSRGSNLAATRVGPTGLIEKGRENLFTYSNQFDTTWTVSNNATVGSRVADPNGGNDAWELNYDGTVGGRIQQQVNITDGGVYVFSIYARVPSGTRDVVIYTTISGFLKTITLTTTWQRFELFRTNVGYTQAFPQIRDNSGVAGAIHIFQAQYEVGLAATDYIESGATTGKAGLLEDEPRFDYSGGATCPSLLLEPSRTNLLGYSEYFNSSYWAKSGSSITSNAVISPDGGLNASKLVEGTNNGVHRLRKASLLTGNTEYTISVFAKAGERTWLNISENQVGESWFDLGNGVTGASSATASGMIAFANGWYICWQTSTPTSTGNVDLYTATDGSTKVYQGDGTSGIYIYGAQLEQASYPTSYIPNHSGGSVTRGADEGETSTIEDVTEGVLFFEGSVDKNENSIKLIELHDGTSNNRIYLYYRDSTGTLPRLYAFAINGGSQAYGYAYDIPSGKGEVTHKVAFRFADNNFGLYYNGVEVHTQTSGIISTNARNQISFASYLNTLNFSGKAKQLLLFPTALSDADCITLTTI